MLHLYSVEIKVTATRVVLVAAEDKRTAVFIADQFSGNLDHMDETETEFETEELMDVEEIPADKRNFAPDASQMRTPQSCEEIVLEAWPIEEEDEA